MNYIASEKHGIWNILFWNKRISDSLTYFKNKVGDNRVASSSHLSQVMRNRGSYMSAHVLLNLLN